MRKCKCCPLVYMSGPLFNTAERARQAQITTFLERSGFRVYLPQRDGMEITPLIQELKSDDCATQQAGKAISSLDLFWVAQSDALLLNANGIEVDAGSVVEAATAYALGIAVVIYYDDIRTFSAGESLNPLILNLTHVPIVTNTQTQLIPALNWAMRITPRVPLVDLFKDIQLGRQVNVDRSAHNIAELIPCQETDIPRGVSSTCASASYKRRLHRRRIHGKGKKNF